MRNAKLTIEKVATITQKQTWCNDADDEGVPNPMLEIQHPKQPPLFMRTLHLEAMHAPVFSEYANIASGYIADGELLVGMQFNN